jgi:integrase/recombinase XerD
MVRNGNGRRKPRRIPDVLTQEEQARLLDALKPTTSSKLRNLCMVRLMLNAGLRSCEIAGARVRDIDFTSSKFTVRAGKGGRERVLWLTDEDLALLAKHVQSCPSDNGALLFQTGQGKPIDTRYLRSMLANAGCRAKFEKQLHPHLLRHTFATDLLRRTKNLRLVQVALGHQDISTTTIYTHIVNDELEEAMKGLRKGGV